MFFFSSISVVFLYFTLFAAKSVPKARFILVLSIHLCFLLLYLLVVDVLVVLHEFVYGAIWREFDYAVGNGLYELVIVACEYDIALKLHEIVVESLNALEVEMVGWCVEYETVGIL